MSNEISDKKIEELIKKREEENEAFKKLLKQLSIERDKKKEKTKKNK